MIFMQERITVILCIICVFTAMSLASGESTMEPNSTAIIDTVTRPVELIRYENEFSNVHIKPARMDSTSGVAVIFEGTDDLHYYAKPETAPAPGLELKIIAKSDDFEFGKTIFPKWHFFTDSLGNKVEVYAGRFSVFVPIIAIKDRLKTSSVTSNVGVKISGIACTSMVCLEPFEKNLQTTLDLRKHDSWKEISLETRDEPDRIVGGTSYSTWFALGLAFLAGLALNIMPCVWPILPLIVMRLVKQSEQSKRKSVAMGLTFCFGILLFFACIAAANFILQSFYDTTLSWGDHLRNPTIVTALALLMVIMALFMFGVFTVIVPASISSKSGSGEGYLGSLGMGFLAAILSTPCSFGILTVAFVWVQAQPLALGTFAIMVIGLGMALPYAILTSMPGLLKRLPKAGRWMELFKQTLGFILLIVAVKLVKAVPDDNKINVLYFAVVLSFCVWMWAGWVSYGAKLSRKLLVRIIAVALAIFAFRFFFTPELINWQEYNADLISKSQSEQKPVLIKFTAGWCTNCEVVDKLVYQRKNIAKLIEQKGVLAIKADTTEKNFPATLALKNIYNEPGVPVSMLFVPGEKEPIRWRGILFADKLKKFLEKLPDSSR
jgi:thiol:disulfide interchange protein